MKFLRLSGDSFSVEGQPDRVIEVREALKQIESSKRRPGLELVELLPVKPGRAVALRELLESLVPDAKYTPANDCAGLTVRATPHVLVKIGGLLAEGQPYREQILSELRGDELTSIDDAIPQRPLFDFAWMYDRREYVLDVETLRECECPDCCGVPGYLLHR